jgi:hypothetical protein
MHDTAVAGQTTVLENVVGTVKYGTGQPVNFLLTVKESVVTDIYSSQ